MLISSVAWSQDDKLLNIIQAELNREVTEFTKVAQPPYFIDYRVSDIESASISSSFGSLTQSYVTRDRGLSADVRVGDYLIDNTHPDEHGGELPYASPSALPLDDNEDAIRLELWRVTQKKYNAALERINAIRSGLTLKKEEKLPPDFSKENAPAKYYEAPGVKLKDILQKEVWEEKTRGYSKLFLADASIVSAEVQFSVSCERRYYVSSEGASVVQNFSSAYINIVASVRATDGEIVPLHQSYYAPTPDQLPGDQTIESDIRTMISTLLKLKTAPLADPYTGPALLDGPVAGVFFHEIFGHRVEGHRLRSEMDGQTFKAKVNERILPESINVYCDPTVRQHQGVFLNGIYNYDDEGVKAERVNVVEKGTLKNFLMSRTPLENFSRSNGHGRATDGLAPVSRQSNLFVSAEKTKSSSELRQMLVKECKKQKKQYGYLFKSVVGGFTTTDRYRPNAFNIFPTEVYRVYVDGRADELVRGVDLIGTPLAMFAEISGVGDTQGVFTGFCGAESGYVPVSAICPSLFVRRIETQKKVKTKVQTPILAPPVVAEKDGDVVLQAMRDELARNMKDLKAEGLDRPFFINYSIVDETSTVIAAQLGALEVSQDTKFRTAKSVRVLVGDYEFNDESLDENNSYSPSAPGTVQLELPLDDDYMGIRRSLWMTTDNVYRNAAQQFARNKDLLKEQNKPLEEVSHRSFAKVSPSNVILEAKEVKVDNAAIGEYVRKLSAAFSEYTDLKQSSVFFWYRRGNRYLVNSEGTINKIPFSETSLQLGCAYETPDGEYISENRTHTSATPDLPPLETMIVEARSMASKLLPMKSAPTFKEEYIGPVLLMGRDVAKQFADQLIKSENIGLVAADVIQPLKGYSFQPRVLIGSKVGKSIFAEGMTVKAVPKMKTYNNIPLLGSFEVDEEGVVPADETILVDNGVLRGFMQDRTVVKGANAPNGLGDGPGVLSVTFKTTTPAADLKAKLIEQAKKEGLDYAIILKNNDGQGAFDRMLNIYKVYVEDGREELVRNAEMTFMSQRDFRKVVAVSKEMAVHNIGNPGRGEFSIICPEAILFEEIEFRPTSFPVYKEQVYVPSPLKK